MSEGTTFKQCGCRDEATGKPLGRKCPKLRRGNGWSQAHGTWYYQIELPPRADGTRRPPLRHGGFATDTGREGRAGPGQGTAGHRPARRPADGHPDRRRHHRRHARDRQAARPRPGPQAGRRRPRPRRPPAHCRGVARGMARRQEEAPARHGPQLQGHIRLYLKPHLGHIPIDRLRVTDVASVFDHIEELNDAIAEARASGNPAARAAVKGRRRVGPATCQRIRATLRSAVSTYMKQHPGALPANVASLVELPPGTRPKALVWTGERVRAWQKDFDAALAAARAAGGRVSPVDIWISVPRPSPVMVWTPAQTMVFLDARPPPPAARPVAADRHPGTAPRRGLRPAPPRHRPRTPP